MDEELKGIRCRKGQRRGRAVEFETVQWDRMPGFGTGKFANNTADTGTDRRNNNRFRAQNNIGKRRPSGLRAPVQIGRRKNNTNTKTRNQTGFESLPDMGCPAQINRQLIEFRNRQVFVLIAPMRICQNDQRVAHTRNNTRKPTICRLQNTNNCPVPGYNASPGQKSTRLGIEPHGDSFRLLYAQMINRLVDNAASIGQLVCDKCNRIPLCAIDIASKPSFLCTGKIRTLDIRPDLEFFYSFTYITLRTKLSRQKYQKYRTGLKSAKKKERQDKRSVNEKYYGLSLDGI